MILLINNDYTYFYNLLDLSSGKLYFNNVFKLFQTICNLENIDPLMMEALKRCIFDSILSNKNCSWKQFHWTKVFTKNSTSKEFNRHQKIAFFLSRQQQHFPTQNNKTFSLISKTWMHKILKLDKFFSFW